MGLRASFSGSASQNPSSGAGKRFQNWFLILVAAQIGMIVVAALMSSSSLLDTLLASYEPVLQRLDAIVPADLPREGNTVLGFALLSVSLYAYALGGAVVGFMAQSLFRSARGSNA